MRARPELAVLAATEVAPAAHRQPCRDPPQRKTKAKAATCRPATLQRARPVARRAAFEAAEQRSPRVGAHSAPPLTRRGCPSGARAARERVPRRNAWASSTGQPGRSLGRLRRPRAAPPGALAVPCAPIRARSQPSVSVARRPLRKLACKWKTSSSTSRRRKRASRSSRAASCRNCTSSARASRGLVGNIYIGRVARVLPGMQSAFVEIGLERAAFLHVADIWETRQRRRTTPPADREDPRRGPAAAGAGGQGPDRHQGRAPVDADQRRRAPARVPAAGPAHRHLAAHRGRERSARTLRERLQRLLPADEKGGFIVRTMAEAATEDELRADIAVPAPAVEPDPRARARAARPRRAALPGPVAGAARAARLRQRRDRAHPDRLARELPEAAGVRAGLHAQRARRSSSTTPASGRCSTSTASRTRSRRRSRAASTSSPAAT